MIFLLYIWLRKEMFYISVSEVHKCFAYHVINERTIAGKQRVLHLNDLINDKKCYLQISGRRLKPFTLSNQP